MNVNVWDVTDPIQRLIRDRVAVDDRQLADPDIPLEDLAADRYSCQEVSRILATANEAARVPVAAFNSAI